MENRRISELPGADYMEKESFLSSHGASPRFLPPRNFKPRGCPRVAREEALYEIVRVCDATRGRQTYISATFSREDKKVYVARCGKTHRFDRQHRL